MHVQYMTGHEELYPIVSHPLMKDSSTSVEGQSGTMIHRYMRFNNQLFSSFLDDSYFYQRVTENMEAVE